MTNPVTIALDIGGSNINLGVVQEGKVLEQRQLNYDAHASAEHILNFIVQTVRQAMNQDTEAVAIGVPCIVDIKTGIIYDAVNVPAWQNYPLKEALENVLHLPVYINNDVNCYVVGEHQYRQDRQCSDVVGICLGTGFGAGFIVNNKLLAGRNCSAGEVGCIPYLKGTIDDYCSGSYFVRQFGVSGGRMAERARENDPFALKAFDDFGHHLAQAISHILLVVDPDTIVLGGSVSQSADLFLPSTWQSLTKFPYARLIENLHIDVSTSTASALLGAAYLYHQNIGSK